MSMSSDTEFLPCSYTDRGIPILLGDSLMVNECVICRCYNATVFCDIQFCPVISCSNGEEPVQADGDCCLSCETCECPSSIPVSFKCYKGCSASMGSVFKICRLFATLTPKKCEKLTFFSKMYSFFCQKDP